MKKAVSLLAASALMLGLAACGDFAPDPTATPDAALDYEYTRESFPELYVSPAYAPLGEAVTAIMLGTTRSEAAGAMTAADSTDAAWAALADGEAGVVLAPEGSDMPGGVDTAAVARDALVFFVGEGSSVDGLSLGELEEIFRGRAGGWEDFGGSGEIRILPRREGSGSIAALERLVGCDAALVAGEAGPLTGDDVIGFALWSECSVMGLADGYKLLAVDGVAPSAQAIASGEYALGVDMLAGVDAGAAEDSAERALWLWLQGGVGQAFISSQGYLEAAK